MILSDTISIVLYIAKAAPASSDHGSGVIDPTVQLNFLNEAGHDASSYPPIQIRRSFYQARKTCTKIV